MWRRRWTILLVTLLGVAGGFAALWNATPMYKSSSQIYVRQTGPDLLGESNLVGRSNNYLNTQAYLLKSGPVLHAAAGRPQMQASPTLRASDNPVGMLHASLDVGLGDKTDILTVSATTSDPKDSQLFVNEIVRAYTGFIDDSHQNTTDDALTTLLTEKAKNEAAREELYAKLNELRRQFGTVSFDGQRSTIEALELQKLSSDLLAAKTEAREAKLALDAAEAAAGNPGLLDALLPPTPGVSPVERTQGELDLLRHELRNLEYTSGVNAHQVRILRQQVEDLERDLAALRSQDLGNRMTLLRRRHEVADGRLRELQAQYDERRIDVLDLNTKIAQEERLLSDLQFVEGWLSRVAARLQEVEVAETAGAVKPEVLEQAGPGLQVAPKASQLVGMGLVLGLMSGLGLAFLQEWLDPRLRSVDEVEDLLGLPVLGSIPTFEGKQTPAARARLMRDHPRSQAAEAYRDVRTMLFAVLPNCLTVENPDGRSADGYDLEGRTVLITSPFSGDGKSTLASNLATSIARMGRRTLLIDADCRRPRIHALLLDEEESEVGLTSVLCGECEVEQAIRASQDVANLSILPCGPLPHDPAEMLNSEAFLDLLDRFAGEYDKVIIDSAPVLPVTDSRVLGALCDATVLVLRAGVSTRRGTRHASDGLRRTGANIVGVVVNDVQKTSRRFGAGYGYGGYAYGYGYGGGNGSRGGNGGAMSEPYAPLPHNEDTADRAGRSNQLAAE